MTDSIKNSLHKGIVTFSYIKKNGTTRVAKGTLNKTTLIAEDALPAGGESPAARAGYISYYDLDKKGWRCFLESKVTEILKVEA